MFCIFCIFSFLYICNPHYNYLLFLSAYFLLTYILHLFFCICSLHLSWYFISIYLQFKTWKAKQTGEMPVLREVGGFIFILYFVFSLTGRLADRKTGRLNNLAFFFNWKLKTIFSSYTCSPGYPLSSSMFFSSLYTIYSILDTVSLSAIICSPNELK